MNSLSDEKLESFEHIRADKNKYTVMLQHILLTE